MLVPSLSLCLPIFTLLHVCFICVYFTITTLCASFHLLVTCPLSLHMFCHRYIMCLLPLACCISTLFKPISPLLPCLPTCYLFLLFMPTLSSLPCVYFCLLVTCLLCLNMFCHHYLACLLPHAYYMWVHSWLGYQKKMSNKKKDCKNNFGFLFILHYYNYSGLFYVNR